MAAQAALYGSMAAIQLAGSYFAAQNLKESAALNRDIAEMNAEFAEIDAWQAERQGESQSAQYQSMIDKTIGEQQARLAATGVDISYGSASTIQSETEFIGKLNQMEIERQADMRASGYEVQARNYRLGGDMQLLQGDLQASQMILQGITSATQSGITGYERSL